MALISQNKKIIFAAGFVFLMSFATMVFFLDNQGEGLGHGKTDVMHVEENTTSSEETEESEFRAVTEGSEDPLVVINTEGKITYNSEDFGRMLETGSLKGQLLFDYINAKDLAKFVSVHSKLISGGEKKEGIGPYKMLRGDEEILVIFNAYPVMDGKKLKEIVFTVRDLSDEVESIQEGTVDEPAPSAPARNPWIRNLYPKEDDVKWVVNRG